MDKLIQDFENLKWPRGSRDKTHIVILAAITLIIGVYFISTTVLIAKDGVIYIEIARKMADNIIDTVRKVNEAGAYSFLVYLMHKVVSLFYTAHSLQGWIISAQIVSLLSKLVAITALYFVGSFFVGPRFSFWSVLILSILPDSVDYGTDALSDWLNIMFLAIGFLLLLLGAHHCRPWIFCCAGIAAGVGFLNRTECGQVVLYGSAWLLFNLVWQRGTMKRIKTVEALTLLFVGFAMVAIPYMYIKGYVFPKQGMWKLPLLLSANNSNMIFLSVANVCAVNLSVLKMIGNETLITNMCETLIYYFIPALLIGIRLYFRTQFKNVEQIFFAVIFMVINVTIVFWQSLYLDFLARRHTFPLVAFTIFFIPVGLQMIADWLSQKKRRNKLSEQEDSHRFFLILIFVGISICGVKLIGMAPLRWEKQGYRDAAEWLHSKTTPADIIAITDRRIAFYAERQGAVYEGEAIPEQADYVVRIIKSGDEKSLVGKETREVYWTWINKKKKGAKVAIYKVIR